MRKDIFYSVKASDDKIIVTNNTLMTYVVTILGFVGLLA